MATSTSSGPTNWLASSIVVTVADFHDQCPSPGPAGGRGQAATAMMPETSATPLSVSPPMQSGPNAYRPSSAHPSESGQVTAPWTVSKPMAPTIAAPIARRRRCPSSMITLR